MSLSSNTDDNSEDEVYFGPMTRKEIRKHIFLKRQTMCCISSDTQEDDGKSIEIIQVHSAPNIASKSPPVSPTKISSDSRDGGKSIEIIQVQSAPNIASKNPSVSPTKISSDSQEDEGNSVEIIRVQSAANIASKSPSVSPTTIDSLSTLSLSPDQDIYDFDIHYPDDSFLKIEKMVNDLCVSTDPENKEGNNKLNSTSDVVEFILSNGPTVIDNANAVNQNKLDVKQMHTEDTYSAYIQQVELNTLEHNPDTDKDIERVTDPFKTPAKVANILKPNISITPTPYCTPIKENSTRPQRAMITSPDFKLRTPTFKTPGKPVSHKKPVMTPLRKQYINVVSPVASYIKNSPAVPLMTNVRPKKPLPGASFIPQPLRSTSKLTVCSNKENVNLPSTAYCSAKEIKVIDVPDDEKLPRSQWAKKVASSIPRSFVMKHVHREKSSSKKLFLDQKNDSVHDLSSHQADLSVCTKKSAAKKLL